ncbi:hypothetical protein NYL07_13945 [Xanthomonas translucens pv. translucens]|jgi:hypothetical protein|uniref:hypothetical protein n=1 Tax=Xanthomonas campestris pv. translucens TaxID=343 RepID=UPI000AA01781|nr:hypothetical protein [Xanthomonas translucens]MCS3360920.1 hypothetical protein [Xanthomonas translucens pv. translucens]MCS3374761.1 hypothetical protein [Xanthomonas translucens pv. translucens]MCT8290501.1 hypothetical protein [Xanthomonas translucens pv. translucens]MCT8294191.1 hypothetical protein [Xanthomonas translucens pv. translucens]MCT8314295.1 hypothetical protein [Xanthomonas translucens pv. translucens]
MLLNIDKPLLSSTLHEESCSYVPKPHGTELKPVEALGRDGGWFFVRSVASAEALAHREFPQGAFKVCTYCRAD